MNTDSRSQTLPQVEAAIWDELARAVGDKAHAWRTPVLATAAPDGADARTVVLREALQPEARLLVYTDTRAAKVHEIAACPAGMLVFWSSALGWQLRCKVTLSVEDSGLEVSSRWARVKLTPGAQDYVSPLPPGAPLAAVPEVQRASREYFGVIGIRVDSLDWLELRPQGQRRARFDAEGARWLQP
ncbi:pyridoxamine 5'-phosphate oxidase family protein [Aquabacterium sp. A7-Y]|uniref:pyridoxamine 5'-phosphate oxidase family protein n=1 Tax=Aquabacterium sp. A7-Y TaxID=1349605 RepID=UPI00223CA383|nr:pyridoxamine 5'-phosphate oxidase family protein [Aquabacterium sp. A7-Y]MCW7541781.1 pyridoxamine 5'-phosphate oxidase family protein [Aquabacterium sp. A7-Y]